MRKQFILLGAAGFDRVDSPAIAFAIAPKPSVIRQDASDQEAVCEGPSLLCDSVNNIKGKCGYPEFAGYVSTPPKFYLTKTVNYSHIGDNNFGGCRFHHEEFSFIRTFSVASTDCEITESCEGSGHVTTTYNPECYPDGPPPDGCDVTWNDCTTPDGGDCSIEINSDVAETGRTATTLTEEGHITGSATADTTRDTVLSDEYSTGQLKTDTIAGVPAYSGTYSGGGCSASRNLSDDESSFSASKFRYKFAFTVPLTNCYKISWIERFTPEDGSGVSDTAKSYIYDGSGMLGDHLETDVHECSVPTVDGATTIGQIWWTCQCGAEPTGGGTP